MATTDSDIETGIETDSQADATAQDVDPDVWAYADDGEYAATWAVERVDDETVRVEYHRHESGLDEVVTAGIVPEPVVETFDVDAETPTDEFAHELANADPQEAIKLARAHYDE